MYWSILKPYRVVEVLEDGGTRPFLNEAWSTAPDEDGVGLSAVIGVQSDRRGVVWILDMGGGGLPPKLVAWDTGATSSIASSRSHRTQRCPTLSSRTWP